MNARQFPKGSIREAVAALGDDWCAAFITADFDCPPVRAEIRDRIVLGHCAFEIATRGRAISASARAGVFDRRIAA